MAFLSLRTLVLATFGLLVLSASLQGMLAIGATVQATHQIAAIERHSLEPVVALSILSQNLDEERGLLDTDLAYLPTTRVRAVFAELADLDASIGALTATILSPQARGRWRTAWTAYTTLRGVYLGSVRQPTPRQRALAKHLRLTDRLDGVLDVVQSEVGARLYAGKIAYTQALEDSWQAVRRGLIGGGVALLAGAGLVALITRRLDQGLGHLAAAATRIRQGARDVRADARGRDEIAVVATAFNHMTDAMTAALQSAEWRSRHDTLTGLANRTLLQERLRDALVVAERQSASVALLLLDLDRFKEINDTLGHHYGDLVLRDVAARLQATVRGSDTVARLGGDEFAVILPTADVTTSLRVAWSIHAAIEEPFVIDGQALDVGISIGVVTSIEHGTDEAALLRYADVAMYAAKQAHSGVAAYTADADGHTVARLSLMSELRAAIATNQLVLHYQPLLKTRDKRCTSMEALVRWSHPQHGLIPPDSFIPLAEHTGLITLLTEWVLRTALIQCHTWCCAGQNLSVQVNISMRTLHDQGLPGMVEALLRETDVEPARLTLEITENALMVDPARTLEVLARLAQIGVRLAIDDFGTGYSSLAYLKHLPVDEVKIDKSFVRDLEHGRATGTLKDTAIVRAVIVMAHALGLEVVAEGVESSEAYTVLQGMGCDLTQGYYLSRPLPVAEIDQWLDNRKRQVSDRTGASGGVGLGETSSPIG